MIADRERPETQTRDQKAQKQILLAYDGSEHAQAAIELLSDLPLTGGGLHVLSVLRTQHISGYENLEDRLDQAAERLRVSGLEVDTELKAGNPAATINAYAAELGVDLIVIGARGLRSALGILLGGVAQQVVEYSCCPVLVVRAPYRGLKRILLAVDGSEPGLRAIEFLAPPCAQKVLSGKVRERCIWLPESAEVHMMHVLPPPIPDETISHAWAVGPEVLYSAPPPPIDKEAIEAEEQRRGKQVMAAAAGILAEAGIQARQIMPRGDAAAELIEYIQAHQIDLVVSGSRGLSQVSGWLLGSVSRKLVHYAGCSALIIKTPGEEHRIGLR